MEVDTTSGRGSCMFCPLIGKGRPKLGVIAKGGTLQVNRLRGSRLIPD